MDFLRELFDTSGFPARWNCGTWTTAHGVLHIASDLAIWGAYFAIPCVLAYFILRRKDLPFRKIFFLFGAFILLCGTTHLMEAIIFWWPAYRLAGMIKFLTAVVSWGTVVALVGAVPKVLAMRSPEELEREISARKVAEEALRVTNAELEQRVESRTIELTQANRTLRAEREWFSTTLTSIGDAVIATDVKAQVTLLNPIAEHLTGWTQREAIGQSLSTIFKIVNEETRETVTNPALRALEDGMIVGLANHTLLICKDGTERPIDDSAAPIKEQNGEVIGAVLVFRDVTERRQLEKQNQERFAAAQFLASIVESSDDAIVSKSLEGIIQSWNFGAERLYGFSAEEAVGQPISLIVPPERAEEEEQIISRLRKGERMDHFETIRLRKDRTPIHVSLTISPIKDETGNVVAISKITRDVTERKLAAMRIEQLLTQLKEADRRKDEFLATLAHELRNPLAPIRTGLDVMKIAKDDPVAIEQVRSTMERQAQQLVTLVDDLLDVSRITQGKFQLKKRRVLLGEIVESAVEATRPFVEKGSHELTVTVPSVEIFLDADPNRLAQVISNLIINACKFTPQGGKIWLRAELHKNGVTITVQDTGMGIPTDKLDRIFEMFAQIDSPTGTSQTGLGIGLTLVKSLVEMHGGTITARSDGPQRGSEFSIQLPTLSEGSVLQNAPSTPDAIPRSHQRRVLVVDDNTSAAEVLGMLVKMLGNEVRIACNGEQAVEQAAEFRPHLILMDLGMPIVDGYEAARRIRQQTWGKEIMLVALTGWGQDEDKRRTKQAGFDDHLVKPAASADLQKLFAKMEPKSNN